MRHVGFRYSGSTHPSVGFSILFPWTVFACTRNFFRHARRVNTVICNRQSAIGYLNLLSAIGKLLSDRQSAIGSLLSGFPDCRSQITDCRFRLPIAYSRLPIYFARWQAGKFKWYACILDYLFRNSTNSESII